MIKLDILTARTEHLFPTTLPPFCGIAIQGFDENTAEADALENVRLAVQNNAGAGFPAEVLPGEEVCADSIVRRTTTAEAIGYDTYHNQVAIEADTKRESIDVGRVESLAGKLVTWRPNRDVNPATEFVLIHGEAA